jgi:hypothetical protein
MEKGLVEKPIDIDTLREVREWYNATLATRKTAVSLMARAGLLPQGRTADDEAETLDKEQKAMEEEEAPLPGLNDESTWDVPGGGAESSR